MTMERRKGEERRKSESDPIISAVGILLCVTGLIAIAFSISLRVIQTELLPQQLAFLHLTTNVFDQANESFEYLLTAALILSGLIVDLMGSRIILAVALGCAVAANYFFSTTHSLGTLVCCRLATESAHIFTLMSVLILGAHWLPRRHFSTYAGLVFGILLLVPLLVTAPLKNVVSFLVVDYINIFTTIIGIIIFALISATLVIPHKARRRAGVYSHFNPLRYYKIWLIGLVAMIGWIVNIFFLSLSNYYFTSRSLFSISEAAHITNCSFIWFGIGCIAMGIFSDLFKRKQLIIAISYLIAAITFSIVIFAPNLSPETICWLVCITTFLAGSNIISYSNSTDFCSPENTGITLGLVLSISTIGSSFVSKTLFNCVQKYVYTPGGMDVDNWVYIAILFPIMLLIGAAISSLLHAKPHVRQHHVDQHSRASDLPR